MKRISQALGVAVSLYAGASAAEETIAVEVGDGLTVQLATDRPLKLAFFSEGTNNSAMTASIEGAQAAAERLGWEIDIFDGRFDAVNQLNQITNALTRDYDAFIVKPLEGNIMCEPSSIMAAERNILVVNSTLPICGRSGMEGEDQYTPGILTYIGGTQTPAAFREVLDRIAAEAPGPQTVAVLTGNDLNPITLNFEAAFEDFLVDHPEWNVVAKARTDWSTPVAFQRAEPIVQANPDLTLFLSHYSNMTRGIVQALDAAGRRDVEVFDAGGTQWAADAVANGRISFTTALYLASNAAASVEAIAAAQRGESVPRYIHNAGKLISNGTLVEFIDASNVGDYIAEAQ